MADRIFILGSVVSRDMLDASSGQFDVAGYLARTSMTGVGLPMVGMRGIRDGVYGMSNPELRRMTFNDLDKGTLSNIAAAKFDAVLLDFVEERFDLCMAQDSLFSYTSELKQVISKEISLDFLKPGSEAFIALWLSGFERLMSALDGRLVILNRVFWAEKFPNGEAVASRGWIHYNNALLQRLYELVDRYWAIPIIDYPTTHWVADLEHRWGKAPYHYTAPVYAHGAGELQRICAANPRRKSQ